MTETELELTEALAARLCHELVSPVGAISNGVEILAEEPDFAEDASKLIGQSARSAARRLQFYRLAYGARTDIADDLARTVALDFFTEGRVACTWAEGTAVPAGRQKLALNLLLVASECLPRGGMVRLLVQPSLAVEARGEGARIGEGAAPLVDPARGEGITTRTVQAIFTRRLAARHGYRIEAVEGAGDIVTLLAVC